MSAYYNEHDPYAAQWLRKLIQAGHIAPGEVDDRSILDVCPDDLRGFTQCHFFAGIGVWSLALRRAGWSDDRPVWTASCPCQPFSVAGLGGGFDDERHLWPFFHFLAGELRPASIFGEQVAGKLVEPWIDLVHADLEAVGYAFGCVPFPSAGVGAPHIRDRAYWVAHSKLPERGPSNQRIATDVWQACGWDESSDRARECGILSRLADDDSGGRSARGEGCTPLGHGASTGPDRGDGRLGDDDDEGLEGFRRGHQTASGRGGAIRPTATPSESSRLADSDGRPDGGESEVLARANVRGLAPGDERGRAGDRRREPNELVVIDMDTGVRTGPTNGHWRAADWLACRDGKWRPVEPGTFPLAHGTPARVGRLRAYGNAINVEAACVFIQAAM